MNLNSFLIMILNNKSFILQNLKKFLQKYLFSKLKPRLTQEN